MSLNQIQSTHGYITINSSDSDGVSISNVSNVSNVSFHEFHQVTVNINYVPTIARAKTAFLIRNTNDSVAQISYRNDVIHASPILGDNEQSNINDIKVQFTGGSATLYIQSDVGRISNISRGIIGSNARRPTGDFDVTVELWSSAVPSGAPTNKIDTMRIRGTINEIFNNPLKVQIIDGQSSVQKSYTVSLPDSETIFLPYLYGYKFVSIPNYLTIKKGRSTILQNDIVQGSNLDITSSGADTSGQITFTICSVDLDKRDRDNINVVDIFDFAAVDVQTQPVTSSGNDVAEAEATNSKLVVTYPKVSNDVRGFMFYNDNKDLVASNGQNNPKLSIWSDSARTAHDGYTTEGVFQMAFPNNMPSGDITMTWKMVSDSPLVKVCASVGAYDPEAEKGNFVSQNDNGIVEGSLILTKNNRVVTFDVKSLKFVSGDFQFTFKLSHGDDISAVAVRNLSAINFRLLENVPKSFAKNKRVYLYDNSLSYTFNPSLNDSSNWTVGTNNNLNILDNTNDDVFTKFINGLNASPTFNLMYGDEDKRSNTNFVGNNGDLGLFIDLSTISTSIYGENDPNSATNLALIVNPTTFNTLSIDERQKNIWKNNVVAGSALNGEGTAKYQVYVFANNKYTVTEYTRYFAADGSKKQISDDSVVLASDLQSLTNYPYAKVSAPNANLFDIPSNGNSYRFTITNTNNNDNYFGTVYNLPNNHILMNPHINDAYFYGKLNMVYNINDGNLPSFNTASTDIYFMPKVKPIANIKRYIINDQEELEESALISYLAGGSNIKYGVTIKIGDDNDFDYIDGVHNSNPYESNANIRNFLRTKHVVHINYSDAIPHETYAGLTKNQQVAAESMVFNQNLSTFNGDYANDGFETLNWKSGVSEAIFDFEPNLGVGKYVTYVVIPIVPVSGMATSVESDIVRTNIWSSQDVEIFGVPIVRGIRISNDITLLGRDDLKTCTTAVVFNDSTEEVNVTVMDITANDPNQAGDHPIYLHTAENQHITIGPGNARVFLRIMFSPEAWEPMPSDYVSAE